MEPTAASSASTLDQLCKVHFAALLAAARDYLDWAIQAASARIREAVPAAHRIYIDGCQRPIDRCWIEEIADRDGETLYRRGEIGMQAQFALDEVNDLLTNAVYSCLPNELPYYWLRVSYLPGMYMFDLTDVPAVAQDDLTDQDRYITAAVQAVADEDNRRGPLAAYLTTICPECDSQPAWSDTQHVLSRDGYVLVGCAGYFVIDPRLVGITSPTWEDWTNASTAATGPDASEPPEPPA